MSRRSRALLAAALLAGSTAASSASAEDVQQGARTVAPCVVQGSVVMPADVVVFTKAQGGEAIARFTGGKIALSASNFPSSGGGGRAAVQTGTGTGSFRIGGYVDVGKIALFTRRDVPVVVGHVWIGSNQQVHVIGGSPGRLKVKKTLHRPIAQSFVGSASCSSFTLEERTPSGWQVPGDARGYVVKRDAIELYSDWQKPLLVTTLHRSADGGGILLWSNERKGGWVHVEYHAEVVIDAWARASDLVALPPGERMDQLHGPTTKTGAPRLALQSTPRLVRTAKETALRLGAKEDALIIGRIEADTETYVLDIVAGWASVLPKALNIAPAGDHQFWAKASDLGI